MKKHCRTEISVQGSERHVSLTHGTHNGRTDTWPHLSDALSRPKPLPDLSPSPLRDRKRGRRHAKATRPQVRISKALYQDGAGDIPRLTVFSVWVILRDFNSSGELERRQFDVSASSSEEAERLAIQIAGHDLNVLAFETDGIEKRD
jgi:hypothetical protein